MRLALAAIDEARAQSADLVLLPELAVTGYPPEDLLLRPGFVRAARESVEEIAAACTEIAALVGVPWFDRDLYNACAVCAGGRIETVYRKRFLPNYGVFDEHRYFASGRDLVLLRLGVDRAGPRLRDERLPVEDAHRVAVAVDRERPLQRRRQPQRHLDGVRVDVRGDASARVTAVRGAVRPHVPGRDRQVFASESQTGRIARDAPGARRDR